MTNPRAGIFAAFRAAKPGIFDDTGNILALDNLCDGYGIGRAEATPAPTAGKLHQLSDAEAFYARVRRITGALDQVQVDTIGALLGASAHWPLGWAAYGFATGWHEARLRPIKEIGGDAYFKRMYDIEGARPAKARELGNLIPGDGVRYCGRGLPQLTGKTNYAEAGEALGHDLVANPDMVLDPKIAVDVMVWGMETGAFTGKKLGDYIVDRGTHDAFVRCRRIINGTDRAEMIATYADQFQEALSAGGWK